MVNSLRLTAFQKNPIALDAQVYCKSGELLALVGASGSGKTTLLKTVAGLYNPTALAFCWYGFSKLCIISAYECFKKYYKCYVAYS